MGWGWQTAYYHPQYFPPTSLCEIFPPSFPPFYLPTNVTWYHPQATCHTPKADVVTKLMSTQSLNTTNIMVYPIPHSTHKASAFLIFQDGLVVDHGFHLGPNKVTTTISTTVNAIQAIACTAPSYIRIFIHNQHAQHQLFSLWKHRYLPEASLFTTIASILLMDEDSSLTTYPFTVRLPGKKSKADP